MVLYDTKNEWVFSNKSQRHVNVTDMLSVYNKKIQESWHYCSGLQCSQQMFSGICLGGGSVSARKQKCVKTIVSVTVVCNSHDHWAVKSSKSQKPEVWRTGNNVH